MINPVEAHKNQHACYIGKSGSGKTTAIRKLGLLPKQSKTRILFYDTQQSFNSWHGLQVWTCSSIGELKKLIKEREQGVYYRIAYQPKEATQDNFEAFCQLANAVANGLRITYVVIDEAGSVSQSIGKEKGAFYRLITQGRKYGIRLHIRFQRAPRGI